MILSSKELKNKPVVITSLDEQDGTINFVFGYVAGCSSVRVKNQFLKEHMSPTIEQILKDTYSGRKYFVKKYEIDGSGAMTLDKDYAVFHQLLDRLADRQLTGNKAVSVVENTICGFCPRDQVWLARILDGNLKIGAGQTFSEDEGTIDKYPCALANVLEKVKTVNVLDGSWFASRKLDGCVDYYSNIEFEDGSTLPIGEVVRNKIRGNIKSWDGEKVVYKPIEDFYEGVEDADSGQKQWYEIELENGKMLKITGNDRVMTKTGWKRVDELTDNDTILIDV